MLAAAMLLAGCFSAGNKVAPAKVAAFERGGTTYAEVIAALGTPNAVSIASTGQRVAVYMHTEAAARAETYIPIIGGFVGGADGRSSSVSLVFDRDGVLQSYTITESQIRTGPGASSTVETRTAPDGEASPAR